MCLVFRESAGGESRQRDRAKLPPRAGGLNCVSKVGSSVSRVKGNEAERTLCKLRWYRVYNALGGLTFGGFCYYEVKSELIVLGGTDYERTAEKGRKGKTK